MSDRINALTVVLERDFKDEDAEAIINAIQQIRGVLKVTPVVSEISDHIAQSRVRQELGQKLWEVLYPKTHE